MWGSPRERGRTPAGPLAEKPLAFGQNNPQSTLLFLETALCTKALSNSLLHIVEVPMPPCLLARRTLAGHAGRLELAPTQLAGRPPSTVLALTLCGGTGVAKPTEMMAKVSGHSRWWCCHSGHPRPLCSYLASARASLTYSGLGRSVH
jgi:hypothetical protein